MSLVDNGGYAAVNASAFAVKGALESGRFKDATQLWDQTEEVINKVTNGVNVYNILQPTEQEASQKQGQSQKVTNEPTVGEIVKSFLFRRNSLILREVSEVPKVSENSGNFKNPKRGLGSHYLRQFHPDPLSKLMNGPIKQMLRIIPDNVTWGGQSQLVFDALAEDFMKPVTQVVENLLNNTNLQVNVYTGQLDMIVDTMGKISIENCSKLELKLKLTII